MHLADSRLGPRNLFGSGARTCTAAASCDLAQHQVKSVVHILKSHKEKKSQKNLEKKNVTVGRRCP